MSLSTQPVKGARDFYPDDMRKQTYIYDVWRKSCQSFGYEEYDAPVLEHTDIYLEKGNQEIIEEQTYTFTDRGGRSLTLRTEMTPTVSRMVAGKQQELGYPLRLFSIPQCWRYERMQRGRGREFYQLNADIFGDNGLMGDQEIIELADDIMKRFGAERSMYSVRINSRKLVNELFELLKLDGTQADSMRRLVDGYHKMDKAEFTAKAEALLAPAQRDAGAYDTLQGFLTSKNASDMPAELKDSANLHNLHALLSSLHAAGISNAVFDPTIIRGFDYYTDIAFEVVDTSPENNRSMFGGGRYEGLVSMFGGDNITAVGFGMGDITLHNFLVGHNLWPALKPATELYAVIVGETDEDVLKPIRELRQMGVNVALDTSGRKLDKQIKTAEKHGLSHVLFIGQKELDENLFTVKNLKNGSEETHSLERIVSIIQDERDGG